MSHAPTLPPLMIDFCELPHGETPGKTLLQCVKSRLVRPPVVQLDPVPTILNRQLQRACSELQILVDTTRRMALQQANREFIHQTMPSDQSLRRLKTARSAWYQQWREMMERLNAVQNGLPDEEPADERDRHTIVQAHRLIESIRHWALGFCTEVDLELDA